MEERELDPQPPKEEVGAAAEVVVPVGGGVPGNLAMTTRRLLLALLQRNFRETAVTARKRVTRRPIVTPRNVMKQVSRILPLQQHESFRVSAIIVV